MPNTHLVFGDQRIADASQQHHGHEKWHGASGNRHLGRCGFSSDKDFVAQGPEIVRMDWN